VHSNNHPIVSDGIVLTHNGRCDNHRELFDALRCDRVGEVDSEAVAALLAHGPQTFGFATPPELLELFRGVGAFAWLNVDEPDVLHLARASTRPLTIGRTRRGDLVYSSTPATLATAADLIGIRVEQVRSVPEGTYLRVESGEVVASTKFAVVTPSAPVPDDRPGRKAPAQAKRTAPVGASKRARRRRRRQARR